MSGESQSVPVHLEAFIFAFFFPLVPALSLGGKLTLYFFFNKLSFIFFFACALRALKGMNNVCRLQYQLPWQERKR
jgi:hypothetical protein